MDHNPVELIFMCLCYGFFLTCAVFYPNVSNSVWRSNDSKNQFSLELTVVQRKTHVGTALYNLNLKNYVIPSSFIFT